MVANAISSSNVATPSQILLNRDRRGAVRLRSHNRIVTEDAGRCEGHAFLEEVVGGASRLPYSGRNAEGVLGLFRENRALPSVR